MRLGQNDVQGLGGREESPVALPTPTLLWGTVLVRVSIFVIKYRVPKQCGNGLFLFTFPDHSTSLREVRQEPGGGS